jgi:biotin-dependent carboxylase-like uncharacterized protein
MTQALLVVEPGALSTVQDCGRRNCAHLGVSPSGAADWFSSRAANRLAGNAECAALLETTLSGIKLQTLVASRIAVTGAKADLSIDGRPAAPWQAHDVPAHSHIEVGGARRGLRSYIAVEGGIAVPGVLGGASTDLGAGFGGHEGRALRAGDVLASQPAQSIRSAGALAPEKTSERFPEESVPHWTSPCVLRAIRGPHASRIGDAALEQLLMRSFAVSSRSTRQGLRLEGEPLTLERPTDIPSAGACAGCVQVTSDGLPLVLLAEHQSTGGYAYALGVITADLPRAGQLRPGDSVRFELVGLVDAAHALELAMRRLLGERIDTTGTLAQGFFEGV